MREITTPTNEIEAFIEKQLKKFSNEFSLERLAYKVRDDDAILIEFRGKYWNRDMNRAGVVSLTENSLKKLFNNFKIKTSGSSFFLDSTVVNYTIVFTFDYDTSVVEKPVTVTNTYSHTSCEGSAGTVLVCDGNGLKWSTPPQQAVKAPLQSGNTHSEGFSYVGGITDGAQWILSPPNLPVASPEQVGIAYYDTTNNKLYACNGATWVEMPQIEGDA